MPVSRILWAAAIILPSLTITAPIGVSPILYAFSASIKAADINNSLLFITNQLNAQKSTKIHGPSLNLKPKDRKLLLVQCFLRLVLLDVRFEKLYKFVAVVALNFNSDRFAEVKTKYSHN